MPTAALLRITRDTNCWRTGQRVWVVYLTGALAALCVGKKKGTGRWIRAWVHWPDEHGKGFFTRPDARVVGNVEVSEPFYAMLRRRTHWDELDTWGGK